MSMHYLFEKYSSQQLNKRKNRVDKWTLKAIRSFKSLFPVETNMWVAPLSLRDGLLRASPEKLTAGSFLPKKKLR